MNPLAAASGGEGIEMVDLLLRGDDDDDDGGGEERGFIPMEIWKI